MVRNYFIIAIRNLLRNKTFSLINITGLSVALLTVMLIMLYVQDEVSFDQFHEKGNRIHRIVRTAIEPDGQEYRNGNSGMPYGPAFAREMPEVEAFCRIKGWRMLTKKGNEGIEELVIFADSSFFKLFSFEVLNGDPNSMLKGRKNVVLSDKMAQKYFGSQNPMGKTVEITIDDTFEPFIVAGVVKHAPQNSSIQFDFLIPFERSAPIDPAQYQTQMDDWMSVYLNTFVLLREGTNPDAVQAKIPKVFDKYFGKQYGEMKKRYGNRVSIDHWLQPFFQMHLDNRFFATNGLQNWSDATYSYMLSGLALLILIIACINFVNLTLARSLKRTKEIGIRKVTGGSRQQLIWQFLGESFLLTLLAFIPAIFLVELVLPTFAELADKHLDASYLIQKQTILLFVGLLFLVAFLAGFYPAMVLSGFNPVQTLYGRFKLSGKNIIGKSLVVMQFTIAILLIIGTIVIQKQFDFLMNTDKGYSTQDVIRVELPWGQKGLARQMQTQLTNNALFQYISAKGGDYNSTVFMVKGKETDWTLDERVSDDFLALLQIKLLKGRALSYKNIADSVSNCVVNEAFVKKYLNKTQDPIGQVIEQNRGEDKPAQPYTVVGVVKDYHVQSLHQAIQPQVFRLDKNDNLFNLYVKIVPEHTGKAMQALEATFKKLAPYYPFNATRLDDFNAQEYQSESRWKQLITIAALMAMMISCLGLFGLATLAIEQRTKEIGIRKVLGASIFQISNLLAKNFLWLVLIAFVIASPVAWYASSHWLNGFAYRINLSSWFFIGAGSLTVLVTVLTVSLQATKAATMSPVKSLKTE